VAAARREALALARASGGVSVGTPLGRAWQRQRFRAPYLRNALWEAGYAVDTLETAVPWSGLPGLRAAVEPALRGALEPEGERVHVFSHVSHVYPDGASLYVTYLYRIAPAPEQTLARWTRLKTAASAALVAAGGTISHQHGVGRDHRAYLVAEKGELGLRALADVARCFDPQARLNPQALLP
jgi:alkyldihydroxyacetonephosphate synthase